MADETGSYGLQRPTLADARTALLRLYGVQAGEPRWMQLLRTAGLSGTETDEAALETLLTAMQRAGPVPALCARSLRVRVSSYQQLSAHPPTAQAS